MNRASEDASETQPTVNSRVSPWRTDVLVIGAGIAGLSLTLKLPASLSVLVVTKGSLGESNTWYAQGGIAAAIGLDDNPELHLADTLAAGAGLCDEDTVRQLVEHGPDAIAWLLEHGTRFDIEHRVIALGKEAAHSRNRILHAGGDATGAEIEQSLVSQLRTRSNVAVLEGAVATDLLTSEHGECRGAIVERNSDSQTLHVLAQTTVLANGGGGQLWSVTSNPPGATGDGIAMALRAGADVADLEFTQFHPTVLAVPGADPFLITEAIRGEGAYLLDVNERRFMPDIHPLAELAPRDVVARAIQAEITLHRRPVSLDLRHLDPDMVLRRFPTIAQRLASHGISLTDDLVPVAPAAHYFMGGIVADATGRTSMPGLFAVGEVTCTGVHGANRLASNSLLEGLVFGLMTAGFIANTLAPQSVHDGCAPPPPTALPSRGPATPSVTDAQSEIQSIMSEQVAVVRSADGLSQALAALGSLERQFEALAVPEARQVRNLLAIALEITRSALIREESRGGHFRSDFPNTDPDLDRQHQVLTHRHGVVSRRFGPLKQSMDAE